jgi:DNA gyrase subunit A
MRLGDEHDDAVLSMAVVDATTDRYVFTVTNKGLGKRTEVQRYRVQGRGGSGIITHSLRDGEVLAGALVAHYENTEVLLMSDAGTVIRMEAAEFKQQSRSTQGVQVMRTGEANVIGLALVVENDEDDDETTPSLSEMAGIDPSEDGAAPAAPADGGAPTADEDASEPASDDDGDEDA